MVDLLVQLALPFNEPRHRVVVHRLAQLLVDLLVLFEQRHGRGTPFLDHFTHGLRIVQLRFLFQITHRVAGRKDHLALKVLVQSAMIFISVDLPEPFRPIMPILAP